MNRRSTDVSLCAASVLLGAILIMSGCTPAPAAPAARPTTAQAAASSAPTLQSDPAAPAETPASTPETTATIPSLASAGRLAVVLSVPGMDQVGVQQNLAYRPNKSPNHLLDVYTPAQTNTDAPTVVLVHGSVSASARLKDSRAFTSWARLLAASGIAAVVINWDHPDATDVQAALDYVRDQAATLRVDPQRLCVLAFSGGVEATLPSIIEGAAGDLRCVVAYYGDVREATDTLPQAQPQALPSLLIVRAGRDEVVREDGADAFVAQAAALGAEVELLTHPRGVHAFDLRNDDDTSRTIITATIAFVQANS